MKSALIILLCLFAPAFAFAEQTYSPFGNQQLQVPQSGVMTIDQFDQYAKRKQREEGSYDFDHEDAYIDVLDALKSKKFVHRVVLKEAISDSSHFKLGRFYLNHLMGFSAVHLNGDGVTQKVTWGEYHSAMQAFSGGYATEGGHAAEIGINFSTPTELYIGYRYFLQLPEIAIWPFAGIGAGIEFQALQLAKGPPAAQVYDGKRSMVFASGGLLMPLLDVGLKMEGRLTLYGSDRVIVTTGVGIILFL